MAEGEGAQERAERRRRHHPVTEHRLGAPGAQHVRVVDVTPARHHRVDQGEHLASRARPPDDAAHLHRVVDEALQTEATDERRNEQQAGVGHQSRLIEGHRQPVDSARYWAH